MNSRTIRCNGVRSEGECCGRIARLVTIKYHFAREIDEKGRVHLALCRAHYEIECPVCGPRIQVEKFRPARPGHKYAHTTD